MTSACRRLALATSVAVVCATPLAAQPVGAPTGPADERLSLASLTVGFLRLVVPYARMVADVRYGSLEVDGSGRGIVLRDLEVVGLGPAAQCTVSLGRLNLTGLALLPSRVDPVGLHAADLRIANNCFGPNAAAIGAVLGDDAINVSQLSLQTRSETATGALAFDLAATVPQMAKIELAGNFDSFAVISPALLQELFAPGDDEDYSSYDEVPPDAPGFDPSQQFDPEAYEAPTTPAPEAMPDGDIADDDAPAPPPTGVRGTLRSAHLTVQDLGGWQRIEPLVLGGQDPSAVIDNWASSEPGTPTRAFEDRIVAAAKAFVADPGVITVSVRPAAPLPFDSTEWETPDDALALILPEVTNAPPVPAVPLLALPATGGDPRALGLAFARGEGAPRNPRRAIELLTPLQDDAEVALALADLTAASDPAAAYGHALRAAGANAPGALAALDRAEAALPVGAILGAQLPATTELPDTAFASVEALRDAALGYEQGSSGAPRSYALAWRLASLAAATGDISAQMLLDRLEARFGSDPTWRAARDGAADQAATDWTGQDLVTRLTGG